ncbi:hypothetical protein PanWU01x14_101820, partial [Parasponia andersonii]
FSGLRKNIEWQLWLGCASSVSGAQPQTRMGSRSAMARMHELGDWCTAPNEDGLAGSCDSYGYRLRGEPRLSLRDRARAPHIWPWGVSFNGELQLGHGHGRAAAWARVQASGNEVKDRARLPVSDVGDFSDSDIGL